MKRTWTIIGVRDVPGSCKWYHSLFGQPATPPAHEHLVKSLIRMDRVALSPRVGHVRAPSLMSPHEASPGNGLLWPSGFGIAVERLTAHWPACSSGSTATRWP